MDHRILEDLGLTNAEIKVYLALLELGSVSAGPIIEKSGLQSSVVFLAIGKLMEKGLVSYVKQGKRRLYQSANPKHLLDYIDEKKERFEEILPELLQKAKLPKKAPEVSTFQGVKGIRELLYELLDAGGTEHHTFGSTEKSLMMGEQWWISYHKKRTAKGIKAKLLFNESLRTFMAKAKYPQAELKFTTAGFEPLTETIIRNDTVGVIIWTDKPLGVLIRNEVAADSYDKFFEVLWNQAEQ